MISWLFVSFSDGKTYKIHVHFIAGLRAKHYADKEAKDDEEWREIYRDEFDFTITDSYELKDWATNNMNWPDVKEFAELVREKQVDYSKEWVNAEKWTE